MSDNKGMLVRVIWKRRRGDSGTLAAWAECCCHLAAAPLTVIGFVAVGAWSLCRRLATALLA